MNFIKSRKYAPYNLGRVCVIGLGKTGLAVAQYLINEKNRVENLHVYAGDKTKFSMRSGDKLIKCGVSISFDDATLNNLYDLCIVSPGISPNNSIFMSALKNCKEVISEVEFAWRESNIDTKWIAVTGTNGKTTTTSMINEILQFSRKRSKVVGNIGNVAIEAVMTDRIKSTYEQSEYFVLEISSYQLFTTRLFKPYIAILLNITPDHINWHGSYKEYIKAKLKIFENAKNAIINIDDTEVQNHLEEIENNKILKNIVKCKKNKNLIEADNGKLKVEICKTEELNVIGEHNYTNARVSCSCAYMVGCKQDQIKNSIINFMPLEHRIEPVGTVNGRMCYNDSKATNVDACIVAIKSFKNKNAIFLLGGTDKGTDLTDLVDCSLNYLKGVVCFGESKQRFVDAFKKRIKDETNFILETDANLKSAFENAVNIANKGDFIVLSPACASFDEFNSFEERGKYFKNLVKNFKKAEINI